MTVQKKQAFKKISSALKDIGLYVEEVGDSENRFMADNSSESETVINFFVEYKNELILIKGCVDVGGRKQTGIIEKNIQEVSWPASEITEECVKDFAHKFLKDTGCVFIGWDRKVEL